MDYTKLPRAAIYEDRQTLDDFNVDREGTLNHFLFDELLKLDRLNPLHPDCEENMLLVLNTAYYIVTMAVKEPRPFLRLSAYNEVAAAAVSLWPSYTSRSIVLSVALWVLKAYRRNMPSKVGRLTEMMEREVGDWLSTGYTTLPLPDDRVFPMPDGEFGLKTAGPPSIWEKMADNFKMLARDMIEEDDSAPAPKADDAPAVPPAASPATPADGHADEVESLRERVKVLEDELEAGQVKGLTAKQACLLMLGLKQYMLKLSQQKVDAGEVEQLAQLATRDMAPLLSKVSGYGAGYLRGKGFLTGLHDNDDDKKAVADLFKEELPQLAAIIWKL